MKTLEVVVPVFNEECCLDETIKRFLGLKNLFNDTLDVSFIFVNDGSTDKTLEILTKYSIENPCFKIVNFSRNFGQQMAVTAGIDYSSADYVAIIDADLQDPPELIYDMYKKSLEGFEIVYGKRMKREGETIVKKVSAFGFYRVLNYMCNIDIPTDTGDFRLMTKNVVENLKKMKEKDRFLRGMVSWVGFRSTPLMYNRDERFAGETKYPISKLLALALDAIFAFSIKPLKIINIVGAILLLMPIAYWLLGGDFDEVSAILFVGAIQIFLLGIVAEYIGRIFQEAQNRPLYIVKDKLNF